MGNFVHYRDGRMMTAQKPMSVSGLTNSIRLRLEEHYPSVSVVGEITKITQATSGHMYFSLKDAGANLPCMFSRGFNLRRRFEPREGMSVVARGGISVYVPRGEYQLLVQELIPVGIGEAELALRELKEKLSKRGWFLPERKRPLPKYPRRIALITSATGAAVRDMLEILAKRWPAAETVVRPSLVQGHGAAEQIAASLRLINALHRTRKLRFDAVVLGRGGGSSEDLSAFNDELVAEAIHESQVIVISAVGHETDLSIADLVADYRALTPSQAIVALCPDRGELLDDLAERSDRLTEALKFRMKQSREQLARIADRPVFRKPFDRIREAEQKLDSAGQRLQRAVTATLELARTELEGTADRLDALSPLNILRRGYAIVKLGDGPELLRSATEAKPGDRLTIQTRDGRIRTRVEDSTIQEPNA